MAVDSIPPPLKFNFTAGEISDLAAKLTEQTKSKINDVTSTVSVENATFENVIIPVGHAENELEHELEVIALLESVSPSSEIRKAASDAVKKTQGAWDAIYDNEQLFFLIDAVKEKNPPNLDEESDRFLTDLHDACISKGLKLTGAARDRFSKIAKRKTELRAAFVANLATDPGFVLKSDSELEGLSKSKLESFEANEDGQRKIPLHRTNVDAIMRQCVNGNTRKDVWIAKESIHPDNAALFREAVLLRDEAARMLGCTSYNHQLVRHRMMKSPDAVMKLLHTVGTKLKPLVKMEMDGLRELRGDGGPIHFWDLAHYETRMLRERNVNSELVAEYFPADVVLARMLEIFEKLFHLEIVEVVDRKDDEVWHPEVKVYTVREVDAGFVGYLYMDLYPREGKYNHAADFNVRPVSTDSLILILLDVLTSCRVISTEKGTMSPAPQHSSAMSLLRREAHQRYYNTRMFKQSSTN